METVTESIDPDDQGNAMLRARRAALGLRNPRQLLARLQLPALAANIVGIKRRGRFQADNRLHDDKGTVDFVFGLVTAGQLDPANTVAPDTGIEQPLLAQLERNLVQQKLRHIVRVVGVSKPCIWLAAQPVSSSNSSTRSDL